MTSLMLGIILQHNDWKQQSKQHTRGRNNIIGGRRGIVTNIIIQVIQKGNSPDHSTTDTAVAGGEHKVSIVKASLFNSKETSHTYGHYITFTRISFIFINSNFLRLQTVQMKNNAHTL
jgi:hypothetical protein